MPRYECGSTSERIGIRTCLDVESVQSVDGKVQGNDKADGLEHVSEDEGESVVCVD